MKINVLLNLMDPYNRRILPGAAEFARTQAWEMNIVDVRTHAQIVTALRDADGLLLGVHTFEHEPILTRSQLPAVSWSGSLSEMNWRRVANDDLAIGRAGAEHLIARGFRHFAFYRDAPEIWAFRRRDGFLGRLEASGFTAESLEPATISKLATLPKPFGAMMAHDQSALGFIPFCREAGLRIPEDVAILGVNNDEQICTMCDPPLSSIPVPTHRIGYECGVLLAKLLDRAPLPPWSIVVPPGDIVVRKSSDTLATSDQLVIDAVKFIQAQLGTGVGTKEVAGAMGVSRTTLDTRFSAAIGRSAAVEIRRERLEKAKQLLASTDLAMSELARQAGFSSARQLSETFHHFVGLAPTTYRAHFRSRGTS